jgi:hypothetical protein
VKVFYFNIDSGRCVPTFTCLPSYKATISLSRIHKIEACFDISGIEKGGYDWVISQVKEENESWIRKHPHLMKSLKKLALKQSLKHPFRYTNFNEENHRFPYLLVWDRKRKFTELYFE